MKSAAIASALFAAVALAAPLDKRVLVTKTNVVTETVLVYTTVWDSPAAPSSSPALFFEQPASSSAVVTPAAAPSSASAVVPSPSPPAPVVSASSAAPPVVPSPAPSSSPAAEPVASPAPSSSPAPAPAPASSAAAPKASAASTGSTSSGQTFTGSLTMNYYGGGTGACGKPIADTEMAAALSVAGFGTTQFDPMTGATINPMCNKKIRVTYNGKSADAVILDRCEGCTGSGGLDATPALWQALTGGQGGAAGDRLEAGMSFTIIG